MESIHLFFLVCLLFAPVVLIAQTEELISGDIFSHFQKTKRWHRVSDVSLNEATPTELISQSDSAGEIFLNAKKKSRRLPYLFTKEKYGDVKVTLEFMIPKNSNAGVYMMGCYEVQIFDSYGVKNLKHSHMGGIYQRWKEGPVDKGTSRGYEGIPPLLNAAKAPGQWQRLEIDFRAPDFDENGYKTKDAQFVSVHLNGMLVQENVSVAGPTRSHPIKNEAAEGPVVIQGDHGPVAIRSFTVEAVQE